MPEKLGRGAGGQLRWPAPLCYGRRVIALIEEQKQGLADLCRRHAVRRLDLFGSAARGDFQPGRSDLDFVVQFARTGYAGYADAFLEFAEGLERLFGRKVDLLTERMIRNRHFLEAVESTREVVYEA